MLSSGGPRFEEVEVEAPQHAPPVSSGDEEMEVGSDFEEIDHGAEMASEAPVQHSATPSPTASPTAADDGSETPGREAAPFLINSTELDTWTTYEHLKYARIIAGKHTGKVLWWDGADIYKLEGGEFARISDL